MLGLPIAGLLPLFGVLASEIGDFLAQVGHLATELSHQFGQLNRLGGREWRDKRGFHDGNACTQNRLCELWGS